jgi:ATP-dependent RNA circularization protein (DNA/RNA ligase family)
VDRRAKELGEDLLLPFYDSIERKTRRENTGHEGPVDQQDREWDEKMRKFRRRKGK